MQNIILRSVNKQNSINSSQRTDSTASDQGGKNRSRNLRRVWGTKVYIAQDEETTAEGEIIQLKVKKLTPDKIDRKSFMHFSFLNASHLLLNLCSVLHSQGLQHKISSKKMRVTYTKEKVIEAFWGPSAANPNSAITSIENASQETQTTHNFIESCTVQAIIGQVIGEQKLFIQFKRITGSEFLFYETAQSIRRQLALFSQQ